MKILFDIGHPAHVHLFKNFIKYLTENNHTVKVVARERELVGKLLEHYQIPYIIISKAKSGRLNMMYELISRDIKMISLNNISGFDVAFGVSVSIAHLSAVSKVKTYCFGDDDDDVVPFYAYLTYPFATKIINPKGTRFSKWKKKRVLYGSYQKLAYLHPDNFKPNIEVLSKYGLKPHEYVIVRISALTAHHDTKAKGIGNNLWDEIKTIFSEYKIVSSVENKINQIEPWDMHDVLSFAKLLITDSQSMSVEASVIGVPNIRFNSFVGKISCLEELENKYKLTLGFKPDQETQFKNKISELLNTANLNNLWKERAKKMLYDKVDFNKWLIDYFETNINTE